MATARLTGCLRSIPCAGRRFQSTTSRRPSSVAQLLSSVPDDSTVTVKGYVNSVRKQKKRCFAAIGDGSSLESLQALLSPEQAENLTNGTAVSLSGTWTTSPNPSKQSCEIHVNSVDILGTSDAGTFPLQKKYQTVDYMRSIPHLRSKAPTNAMLLRFRSDCISEITKFFAERDYIQTHPPVITSSDCEGAGEVFSVVTEEGKDAVKNKDDNNHFFRSSKYLTVSTQLHLEALAQSLGKVWTLAPTFRAEKSDTPRHLSEFYMLEAEITFVEEMSDIMDVIEDLLRRVTSQVSQQRVYDELINGRRPSEDGVQTPPEEFTEMLKSRWTGMMKPSWPRITYSEAIRILQESRQSFEHAPQWGSGLQAEHERYIATNVGAGSPVFVTQYPATIKPFYMLPTADADAGHVTVDCFDLLVPDACEIVGGSMREHRLEELLASMRRNGMVKMKKNVESGETEESLGNLQWYVDLRRWGSVPHGGFGLGFDRLLCYLAGVNNIRETVAFPRWVGRCDC